MQRPHANLPSNARILGGRCPQSDLPCRENWADPIANNPVSIPESQEMGKMPRMPPSWSQESEDRGQNANER